MTTLSSGKKSMNRNPMTTASSHADTVSTNQRDLLNLIRENQPIRRSALAGMTDLTQQSVHRILASLEELNLIKSERGETSGPGKPSPNIVLNDTARFGVGILVNTDSVVLALAGLNCTPIATRRCTIDVSKRGPALDAIEAEVTQLLIDENVPREAVQGIGFTLPGFFVEGRVMFNAPELLRDWSLIDLRPEIMRRFDLPVTLENSANAGAIGETLGPLGNRYKNFVYLGFDYGFGGAIVINGRLHAGRAGNAGELSAIWTEDEAQHRPAMGLLLTHLKQNGIVLSGIDELRREFDPDWPGLQEWVDQTMPHLNRLISGLTGILDPEAIVFGGQIAPQLAQILIERVSFPDQYRYSRPPPLPDLVPGSDIKDPAASGVAQLPLKQAYFW